MMTLNPSATLRTVIAANSHITSQILTAHFDDITGTEYRDVPLTAVEVEFLRLASEGKVAKLRKIVEEFNYFLTPLNINCTDSLDRTALTLAIINGHHNVVNFLLNDTLMVGIDLVLSDALFHAIDCEFHEAIKLLIEKDPQSSLQIQPGTTSSFSPGLTPLMLAAQKNNYKIIRLLYKYNHRLNETPDSSKQTNRSSWDTVMENLLHYEARASPAYMLLMYSENGLSWDPLMKAMELYKELMTMAQKSDEVSERYIKAAENCEQFAMDLLQNVRSASELSGLMRFRLDEEESTDDNLTNKFHLMELEKNCMKTIDTACNARMMNFVTSDNAQLALTYVYRGKIFRNHTGYKVATVQVLIGILFPFLSVAQLMFPKSYIGKLSKNPTVKYWSHVMSEMVFISLLISNTIMTAGEDEPVPTLLAVSYFWILGKLVQEIREFFRCSTFLEYFASGWNWNDLGCIAFFSGYMVLRVTYYVNRTDGRIDRFYNSYHIYWFEGKTHLLPISDIFIAFAYIFVFMRILELLRASRYFGPLQLSLDRMAKDAFLFLILFAVFFFAFGTSITQLFVPYGSEMGCSCDRVHGCQQRNYSSSIPIAAHHLPNITEPNEGCDEIRHCKGGTATEQQFTELSGTMYGLFWTLFGYGNPTDGWLRMNCPDKQYITWVGSIILGAYHFCGIVVLLNMLIAMMSSSFQKTTDNSEKEWKFHRTQLWLKYVHNDVNRPPPMNLLPNFVSIAIQLRVMFRFFQKTWRKGAKEKHSAFSRNKCNTNDLDRIRDAEGVANERTLPNVLSQELQSDPDSHGIHGPHTSRKSFGVGRTRADSNIFIKKTDQFYAQTLRMVVTRYIKQKSSSFFHIE